MFLAKLNFIGIPGKHSDKAARQAVLYKLNEPITAKGLNRAVIFSELKRRTLNTIELWRSSLVKMKKLGWILGQEEKYKQFQNCINCRPCFLIADEKIAAVTCKQASICPFCYGRNVQELFDLVHDNYSKLPKKDREKLAVVAYKDVAEREETSSITIKELIRQEKIIRSEKFKQIPRSLGGWAGVDFEYSSRKALWEITRKGLAIVPRDTQEQIQELHNLKVANYEFLPGNKSRDLIGLISSMSDYPVQLLKVHDDDRRHVVEYLHAKGATKLNVKYGCFRNG